MFWDRCSEDMKGRKLRRHRSWAARTSVSDGERVFGIGMGLAYAAPGSWKVVHNELSTRRLDEGRRDGQVEWMREEERSCG